MEADYFLSLCTVLKETDLMWNWGSIWKPWSMLYMQDPPRYLIEASRKKYAEKLLRPLGVNDIEMLRARLAEQAPKLSKLFGSAIFYEHPLEYFDVSSIGSR